MGAIADSMIETSTIKPSPSNINLYKTRKNSGVNINLKNKPNAKKFQS